MVGDVGVCVFVYLCVYVCVSVPVSVCGCVCVIFFISQSLQSCLGIHFLSRNHPLMIIKYVCMYMCDHQVYICYVYV